jgi:DNA-3-methyladenine glycosylase II
MWVPMKKITYTNQSEAVKLLINRDPILLDLFSKKESIDAFINPNYFLSLIQTITAQQLSSRVAQVIYQRLEKLFHHDITIEKILLTEDETFRSIGLSYQKTKYLKSLAEHMKNHHVTFDHIEDKSDQEIIDMLTQIKGIGVWSAQMFLMFSLGREDVFSVLDLGLRNAVKKLYNQENLSHQEIDEISQKWQPYRSIVSHYLWHAWDVKTK